jgi:hypothetical protein
LTPLPLLENPSDDCVQHTVGQKEKQRRRRRKNHYHYRGFYHGITVGPYNFEPFAADRFDIFNKFFHILSVMRRTWRNYYHFLSFYRYQYPNTTHGRI